MEFSREKYLNQLLDKKNNSLIKIITGARRSGKSYLMNNIFYKKLLSFGVDESSIIRFSFDNDEDIDLLEKYYASEPTKIYDKNGLYIVNSKKFRAFIKEMTSENETYYLLLDEIQLLDSFVGTLNGFLTHSNYDVYVTGSNSQLLSSEIETKFRGRKSSIHLLPLSFSEFMTGFDMTPNDAWNNYIVTGGIPIVYRQGKNDRRKFLIELANEVYLKDIIGRKNIKEIETLKELFGVLASSIGSPTSPTKLEKSFKSIKNVNIANDTINNYVTHFEDAFVVSKAFRYDIKGKAYINTPYKVYFEDVGIRNAVTDFRQIEETHLMENVIFNELRYRQMDVSVGEIAINEPSDRIDKNGKKIYVRKSAEVDFVATNGEKKYYVQCCLNINEQKTLEREKRSLKQIGDSFKKIIITKDSLPLRRDENGFVIIDLFDFLLNYDSLDF